MSALIRDRHIVEDDYASLADDAPLPPAGKVIVSLERWSAEREALQRSGLTIGVRIPNTADLAEVWPQLSDRPLIEVQFPAFGDGRAYSQARLLRERYGFKGELRASGAAVVIDQAAQLSRCGVNAFVLRADQRAEAFVEALQRAAEIAWYQGPSGAPLPLHARRQTAA